MCGVGAGLRIALVQTMVREEKADQRLEESVEAGHADLRGRTFQAGM